MNPKQFFSFLMNMLEQFVLSCLSKNLKTWKWILDPSQNLVTEKYRKNTNTFKLKQKLQSNKTST